MEGTENNMNIYQKLIEVRKAVPYLKKDEKGYQFKFVSSSQVLGTLKAKMDSLGLLLVPQLVNKTVSDHTTKDGGHNYFTEIEMEYTWINAENPQETITCKWYGQGLDSGEKGVGKAYTYSEKYFLLKFFNIPTDKDDPDAFQSKVGSKVVSEPITKDQTLEIESLKEKLNPTGDIDYEIKFKNALQAQFKKPEVDRLDTEQAKALIAKLKARVEYIESAEKKTENNH